MQHKITTILVGMLLGISMQAQTWADSLKATFDSLLTHLCPSQILHNRIFKIQIQETHKTKTRITSVQNKT